MSKPNLRKITVDPTKCNTDSRRPSVFERLGTKPATANSTGQSTSDYCRNWALNGSCSYGKSCKYANTHTLISPSKRVKKDNAPTNPTVPNEDPFKRLTSKIVKKTTSHSPDLNLEEWNQTDLEYEDEKVLERRRQLLQRELELQMKNDKEVHRKDKAKHKKKAMTSSSSSHSSSSSSSSSTSSSDDSSSSSTSDSRRKVKKVKSKRHHSPSSEYDEERERRKKLKLKRLGTKTEKVVVKKKRKVEVPKQKEPAPVKVVKKVVSTASKKHSTARQKSPQVSSSHATSSKFKERNRSESPKPKSRESEKEKHHKKTRDDEILTKEVVKSKVTEKVKDAEKSKSRPVEDRGKQQEERAKPRLKEKEIRSRTPPIEKSKHHHVKDPSSLKSRRSRTPEKSGRSKRDSTPPPRHPEPKIVARSREVETKKDRDGYKGDRGKEKDEVRKPEAPKPRPSSSQDDGHRAKTGRGGDLDDKSYGNDRNRQRSKERRDKDHNPRDDRSHSRLGRDQRDKEREELPERCRERQRERDRDKDSAKTRERDIPPLLPATNLASMDKPGRYNREKDRFKDGGAEKSSSRDRRAERDRERSEKPAERDRGGLQRGFEGRYDRSVENEMGGGHKGIERDNRAQASERFPRERSMENRIVEKSVSGPRDGHALDRDNAYDRDRLRRFNSRFDRGHPVDHDRKEPPHIAAKIDRLPERRDGPRRSLEMERNYDRGYGRLPPERWENAEEPPQRIDYRDHRGAHDDDRRKPMEGRRYNSPFDAERRGRDDRPPRYAMQPDRTFDEPHMPHFGGADKLRGGVNRDESSNENWDVHHELDHASRDRNYPNSEWEEREWRARAPLWDRESPPRSEVHEEEWAATRYDSPMSDWKMNEPRKWENAGHPRGPYRNERVKDLEMGDVPHGKRRTYATPELRDECSSHASKQATLHGSMKEEPINKKLMELAEGRITRSREKSLENFNKRITHPQPIVAVPPPRAKSEAKEAPAIVEPKRPCLDESLQTLHTESDLSDISDDPDDILNMDEEEASGPAKPPSPKKSGENVVDRESQDSPQVSEAPQLSPKESVEEQIFTKEKDTNESMEFRHMGDENVENMDFEEISDGELEEDIKTSGKGLGDALGVDWESLVKESQPIRASNGSQETAQNRWQCKAIFQRIGISAKYAGSEMVESLSKKYGNEEDKFLLHDVALLHVALVRQRTIDDASRNSSTIDAPSCGYLAEVDDEEEIEEDEVFKPRTSLFDEVQLLLQNVA